MSKCSYVVETVEDIPKHLNDFKPEILKNTQAMPRRPETELLEADGRVKIPGSFEFRTSVRPGFLLDVCDPEELYKPELCDTTRFRTVYDPRIQRGVKESKGGKIIPVLNEKNIESMLLDITKNEFECPELMWNLRFNETCWVYIKNISELRVYEGVATRPDTNHRHHAIIRAHRQYRKWKQETDSDKWENYNPERQYALAIYTDTFEGEAHKFYVLNSKGAKVAPSKAHYVEAQTTNPHAHSRLAKDLMDSCGTLTEKNVEIVQSTLSKNSAKMVMFYTLVRGLQGAFPYVPEEEEQRDELLQYIVSFVAELQQIRPNEIALLSLEKRQQARTETIADQALTWIAYFKLAAWLKSQNNTNWQDALKALSDTYTLDSYTGDFLSRNNPLWIKLGILLKNEKGQFRVISNRNAQAAMQDAIIKVVDDRIKSTAKDVKI